jgi:hypothetical protein
MILAKVIHLPGVRSMGAHVPYAQQISRKLWDKQQELPEQMVCVQNTVTCNPAKATRVGCLHGK